MSIKLFPLKFINKPLFYSTNREWLHENINGNKNLLICIGDSWTWGDSLGKTTLKYNDKDTRYNQFYIAKLAKKLDSDWLMIAWCGHNNKWILDQYHIINQLINNGYYKDYDNVYIHVCLTELFREIDNNVLKNTIKENLSSIKNFKEFCSFYFELTVLNRLKNLSPIPKLHSFSKNFWDLEFNYNQYNFLDSNWQQLLFKKTDIKDNEFLPVISSIGIEPLINFLKENKLKELEYEFSELLIKINKRVDNMIACALNHKKATKHPTAEGHQNWADYLYNYYKDL